MQNIILILNIVAPVFLMILLGVFLKRIGLITDPFIKVASMLVFKVALPVLIFLKISATDFTKYMDWKQVALIYGLTLVIFIVLWIITHFTIPNEKDRGSFIQGSFRGNIAIIGLALIDNTFGSSAMSQGALLLTFFLVIYNTLSIIALSIPSHARGITFITVLKKLVTNPLIIAPALALPFSIFKISLPPFILKGTSYLSALALPLALLAVGGTLSLKVTRNHFFMVISASVTKIIIIPILGTVAAHFLGYKGQDIGILFILFACPTAVASFVMAQAMGCNSRIAGDIITVTTLGSVITISLGMLILKSLGWIQL